MGIIETVYAARSEPARLKEECAEEANLLVDEEDGIDFIFVGNGREVFFERKKAQDLINSFLEANEATGEPRVVAQIRRLVESRSSRDTLLCLLVEDHIYNRRGYAYAEGVRRKIPFNAVDNFLLLVQRWGILVVRSTGLNHTTARMVSVAEGWLSAGDKSPIIMMPKAPAPQLRTLMTFPRVGIKGAQKLAKGRTLRWLLSSIIHGDSLGLGTGVDRAVKEYLDTPISLKKRGE